MTSRRHSRKLRGLLFAPTVAFPALLLGACGSDSRSSDLQGPHSSLGGNAGLDSTETGGTQETGGTSSAGGSRPEPGSTGASTTAAATGGRSGPGVTRETGIGGADGFGGRYTSRATGGRVATGGVSATGGNPETGGRVAYPMGGSAAIAGNSAQTGGNVASGGASAPQSSAGPQTGGALGTGGAFVMGGSTSNTCTSAALDCGAYGSCADTSLGPRCVCDSEHTGATCRECAPNLQDNDGNGTCTSTCTSGVLKCGAHGDCVDGSGTALCLCKGGYVGSACDSCPAGMSDALQSGTCAIDPFSGWQMLSKELYGYAPLAKPFVDGNYLYVCNSLGALQIYDIHVPSSPELIASVPVQSFANDVFVTNGRAYVTDYWGLEIIDVSNPSKPIPMSTLLIEYGNIRGVAVRDGYAYLANEDGNLPSNGYLHIVDVSNPLAPALVKTLDVRLYANEVAISGNYAIVDNDVHNGLYVADITNPLDAFIIKDPPTATCTISALGGDDFVVDGSNAYIAERISGLEVVDFSNPLDAHHAYLDECNSCTGVAKMGNHVLMADGESPDNTSTSSTVGKLVVVDATQPMAPVLEKKVPMFSNAWNVAAESGYAYVSEEYAGLEVVDLRSVPDSTVVKRVRTTGATLGVASKGNYVYAVETGGHVQVVDASTPAAPKLIDTVDTVGTPKALDISGNYAFVATHLGLEVLDISTPGKEAFVGTASYPEASGPASFEFIRVQGHYAYVGTLTGRLLVLDITDPTKPSVVKMAAAGSLNRVQGLAVSGTRAYTTSAFGLHTWDISNPTAPVPLATMGFGSGDNYSVIANGNTVYVARFGSVQIVDVSDPSNPVDRGPALMGVGGSVLSLAIYGQTLYVGKEWSLNMLDVSNAQQPACQHVQETSDPVFAVASDGLHAYLGCKFGGVRIVGP